MNWNRRSRLISYLRSSLWIVPVATGLAERAFRIIAETLDARIAWTWFELGIDGAKALASTVTTLTLAFVAFTFGSLLVAIQVASEQYTPHIIATMLLCNNVIR